MENFIKIKLSHGRVKSQVAANDEYALRFTQFIPRGDAYSLEFLTSTHEQDHALYSITSNMVSDSYYGIVPNPIPQESEAQTYNAFHYVLLPWFIDENNKTTFNNTRVIGGMEILECRLSMAILQIILKLFKENINVIVRTKEGIEKSFSVKDYTSCDDKNILEASKHREQFRHSIVQMITDYINSIPKADRKVLPIEYYHPPMVILDRGKTKKKGL